MYNTMGYNFNYTPIQTEIPKVNGKDGALNYQLANSSSILLLDTTQPVIWCKVTDPIGMATVKGYFITPIEDTNPNIVDERKEYVSLSEFNDLKNRFDKLMEELNGKPNT